MTDPQVERPATRGTQFTKSYTIFRMVPLSMTPISSHDIFLKSNIVKTAPLKDKVTIAQEETIPTIWNGIVSGDLN